MNKIFCAKCKSEESNINNKHGNNYYYGEDFELWFCNNCAILREYFIENYISKDRIVLEFIKRDDLPNHL